MNSSYRRFPKTNSMLTLGALVFAGVVITTLAHAEGAGGSLRYLSAAGAMPPPDAAPSRHHWLLPEGMEGRLEVGDYQLRFPAGGADAELAEEPQPLQLRLRVGGGDEPPGFARSVQGRALMSDSEREQQRLNGSLFSMSVSRTW